MPSHLHITNGDSAGDLLKESGLGGDVLPWRDTMFEGPFPEGLDLPAASDLRAAYLGAGGLSRAVVRLDFQERDARLRDAGRYDAITLWFEHDLLDQLQLLQLLDWFAAADIGDTDLGMICIGDHPEVADFHGLGELTPAQVAALAPQRAPVTPEQLRLGREGWAAFRSPDPRAIERYMEQDLTVLPFMAAALRRHLEEFPSVADGLGRTHRQLLTLIAEGVQTPVALFVENMARESVLHMGDWSTFRRLDELFRVEEPLLMCRPFGVFRWPPGYAVPMATFRAQKLELSEKGRAVLAGEGDGAPMRGFDYWLGGVHFENGVARWRWDAEAGCLRGGEGAPVSGG